MGMAVVLLVIAVMYCGVYCSCFVDCLAVVFCRVWNWVYRPQSLDRLACRLSAKEKS